MLLDTEIHGHIPVNAGLIRPITIVAPKGCLANPTFPAPTIARFCPGNQLADTVMKALSAAMPGNVSAGIGNLKVIAFSGLKDETHWVHMEIFEGSYGGRLGKDGMDAVDTLYANTRNNPIEDIETHLPLRVLRYELREDVAGAGKWRGGLGSVREFTFLSDGGASVEGEGHRYRPWGFLGGSEGMPAKLDLVVAGGATRALPSKVPHMNVAKDGRFVCYGPAGGGYGNPLERDPSEGRRRCAGRRDLGRDGAQGLRRRGIGDRRGGPGRGRRSNVRREPRARRAERRESARPAFVLQRVDHGPGLRSDDAVHAEIRPLLQVLHGRLGLRAEPAVDATGVEADRAHAALQPAHRQSAGPDPEHGLALVSFIDVDPRHAADNPVHGDFPRLLESFDRTRGSCAESTVDGAGIMSQRLERLLKVANVGAARPLLQDGFSHGDVLHMGRAARHGHHSLTPAPRV